MQEEDFMTQRNSVVFMSLGPLGCHAIIAVFLMAKERKNKHLKSNDCPQGHKREAETQPRLF